MNIKNILATLFLISGLLLNLLPIANAQLGVGAQTSVSDCRSFTVSSSISSVAAGSIVFCSRNPNGVANSAAPFRIGATLTTPQLTGSSPNIDITLNALNGCTTSSNVNTATSASAAWGVQESTTWMMTMAGASCTGYFRGTVTSGGNTIFDEVLDFTIVSGDNPNYNVNSGSLSIAEHKQCDVTPPVGPNLRFIDYGCWSAIIAVPDVITARNEDGQYIAHWAIICVSDMVVYPTENMCANLRASGLFQYPFEAGETCTNAVVGFEATHYANTNDGSRNRQSSTVGQITFTGSGCIAKILISPDISGTKVFEIPIIVRSEGYNNNQETIDGTLNSILSGDINTTLSGDIGFSGNFTDNSNTTITPAYQDTEAFQKAKWMGIVFLGLILMAEWKKDAIYHLLATILGALISVSNIEVLGLPRMVILAVTAYQAWRLYKVVGNNRNNLTGNESSSPT